MYLWITLNEGYKMTTFNTNTQYEAGQSEHGYSFTMEVVKRTAKFLTIKGLCGTKRVKILTNCKEGCETVVYGCDMIHATEVA